MINALVCDLIETTAANIARQSPKDLAEARQGPALVAFSDELREAQREMKRFLRAELYQHYQVLRMTSKARRIISDLFGAFIDDPRLLPPQYQAPADGDQARSVADYIAGMTDRYAMKEHRRLFAVGEI
jgi:dGTPase